MTYLPNSDWYVDIQKGLVPGHSMVHKFGRNPTVPNGTFEGVLHLSTTFVFLTAPTTVRVKAGNVADTSGGAGARIIHIEGLDDTGAFAEEDLTTAGASASANSSNSYWRVFRCFVSSCGTYGAANTAAVVIENSAGTLDLISIAIQEGQSQYGAYAIPLAKTGYLISVQVEADAAKAADFRLLTRENLTDATSAPFEAARVMLYWDGVLGQDTVNVRSPILVLPALTDIFMEVEGEVGGSGTEASCDFEILIVDD